MKITKIYITTFDTTDLCGSHLNCKLRILVKTIGRNNIMSYILTLIEN